MKIQGKLEGMIKESHIEGLAVMIYIGRILHSSTVSVGLAHSGQLRLNQSFRRTSPNIIIIIVLILSLHCCNV